MTRLNANSAAIEAYIARGREALARRLPGVDFDAPKWATSVLATAEHKTIGNATWTHPVTGTVLPPEYALVVKAAIALQQKVGASRLRSLCDGARWLWVAIEERLARGGGGFAWRDVVLQDVQRAEDLLEERYAPSTRYLIMGAVKAMLEALAKAPHYIVGQFVVQIRAQAPASGSAARPDDVAKANEAKTTRMPSDEAIFGLGDIWKAVMDRDPAEIDDPAERQRLHKDRFLIATVSIQYAMGARIGEVLTLPALCEDEVDGAYIVRYFKEKSRGRQRVRETYSPSKLQTLRLREAIGVIRHYTSAARDRARVLAQTGQMRLPGLGEDALVTRQEIANLCGIHPDSIKPWKLPMVDYVPGTKLKRYRVADVNRHLTAEQTKRRSGHVVTDADGTKVPLHEALFCMPLFFLHEKNRTHEVLVENTTAQMVDIWLGGVERDDDVGRTPSVFERYGIKEKDGSFVTMTTHELRHFLTTKLDEAGLTDDEIMRQMNRESLSQLDTYRHLTKQQLIDHIRGGIRSGRIVGAVADKWRALADDLKDAFLERAVANAHFTGYGYCIHDFSASRCPRHLACVGCKHNCQDTSDPNAAPALIQLRRQVQDAHDEVQAKVASGEVVVSDTFVEHTNEKLAGLDVLIAVVTSSAEGMVYPFPDGEDRFDPMPALAPAPAPGDPSLN